MRITQFAKTLLSGAFITCIAGTAFAQSGPATLEMLGGWRTESGTHMAAFEISLEPGWKTYWRSPGDSGIPPRIDWSGSKNIGSAEFHWPRPKVFDEKGARTIGYKERLVLPVELTPLKQGSAMAATGEIEIGVCLDVCVPVAFRFSIDLPNAGAPEPAILSALELKPRTKSASQVGELTCEFDPISDGMRVTARIDGKVPVTPEVAIFEHSDKSIWISGGQIVRDGSDLTIVSDFVPPEAQPFAVDRSQIMLTLVGKNSAVEISGCPAG